MSGEGGRHPVIALEGVTKQFPDGTVAVDELTMETASGAVTAATALRPPGLRRRAGGRHLPRHAGG